MAQIAMQVFQANVKHPERWKLSDFLLKFNNDRKRPKPHQSGNSQAIWLAWAGIDAKKVN